LAVPIILYNERAARLAQQTPDRRGALQAQEHRGVKEASGDSPTWRRSRYVNDDTAALRNDEMIVPVMILCRRA
jgi:hypothetical protein